MAQAPKTEAAGTGGESLVRARLELMGFGVLENSKHDLGIDLFVMVRDRRRFERPTMMMFQSKTESEEGESYFSSPEKDADGNIVGWWYAEPDATHFNDWVQHSSPHILVLTDAADERSYWVHVTKEAVKSTGKGYKILVPAHQLLRGAKEELLAIAEASQVQQSFQGTYFHASAQAAAPGRVLRYALLTPRLIAPHPNTLAHRALEPEEAIALIAAGRRDEFRRVAQASVDEINDAGPEATDWRWRMFNALDRWIRDYDSEPLRTLALATCTPKANAKKTAAKKSTAKAAKVDNQPKERRAAVAVAAAAAQSEIGRWDEAAKSLKLADSDLDPVDHAWVEMWKALVAAELDQFTAARDHAVEAMKTVLLDQNDPTAAAIGAAASSYLFRATDEQATGQADDEDDEGAEADRHASVDLTQLLTLNDTAASWWRAQAIGSAVREYDDYAFRAWAGRSESDQVLASSTMQLRSVWVSALLAGDLGAAGRTAELWSTRVVRASTAKPWQSPAPGDIELVRALDALRHAGREAALTLVSERLWRDGDTFAVIAALSNARREHWWTPSTARAHLSLLTAAGDLLEEADADAAVIDLLEMIEHPKEFSDKHRTSFDPRHFALRALATVLPAAGIDCQVSALKRVLKTPATEIGQLADHLRRSVYPVLAGSSDKALLVVAQTVMTTEWVSGENRWPFLAVLRGAGSDAAADEIAAELGSGNLLPLQTTSDFDLLSRESLLKVINGEARACEELAHEAATIGPAFGGVGISAARLVAANLRSPEQARWQPLHTLLAEERAAAESKLQALTMLLADWSLLPEDEQQQLRELYRSSGGFASDSGLSRSERYSGVTTAIGHRLGEVTEVKLREQILSLLPGDPVRRLAAAQLITDTDAYTSIDVREVLAADPNVAIRAEAAVGLLKSDASDPRVRRALEMVLAGDGCYVAYRVAEQLVSPRLTSTAVTDAATAKLASHRSARVRRLAQRAAARQ